MSRRVWLLAGALVLLAGWCVLTAVLFVWPREQAPRAADAVAVLGARSAPDRLDEALRLMTRRTARTLVVLTPPEETPLCHGGERYEVICIMPRPFNTKGEAEALGRLAKRRAWRNLTVVTSTYHVTRARLLLSRCFDGSLTVVGSHTTGIPVGPWRALHEWGGLLWALVRPGC